MLDFEICVIFVIITFINLNNLFVNMKKAKRFLLTVASKASIFSGVAGAILFGLTSPVYAQGWLPDWIQTIVDTFKTDPIDPIKKRVQWALTKLFVVVFVVAIIYSALAAIKFISSQGESGKLEESKAAVKAILMGFAAMLISIVGIFIIIWLFARGVTPETEPPVPTW